MADCKELLGRSLPKWPQFLLSGQSILREQALEIIRRTDSFFAFPKYAGNNAQFLQG